jgi:hypothetical protein
LSEPAAEGGDASSPPGSISFIVATENGGRHAATVIDVIGGALRAGDEAILLTRSDHAADLPGAVRPWLRIVGIPDANIFTLRCHVPHLARRDWVVLLEEHALITGATLAALRALIRARPELDLVAFLGRNSISVSLWGWANFLHTFALVWMPLDGPPPFAPVTNVAVRRAALGPAGPLHEGDWELRVIPRLFAAGRFGWDNAIHIDHLKALNFAACFILNFHNARAGASHQRRLGVAARVIVNEGWYNLARRPRELAGAIAPRRHELPAPMLWPLRVVGLAFFLGCVAGAYVGPGRSAHRLD